MRLSLSIAGGLVSLITVNAAPSGCPWLASQGLDERGLLDPLTGTLAQIPTALTQAGGLLEGLVGSLAAAVNPEDRRPDASHPFLNPGASDQRGPCPGLNTLANHGYLPRNGIVTAGQVVEAVSEGFNMATDLSTLLVTVAVAFTGNIATETFSIGGEDSRTYSASGIGSKAFGRQFGLDGHSRCEGDASATRADFYLNNGDNHNGQPDRFKRFIKYAKQNNGEFNVQAANQLYGENIRESIANNPRLFFQGYTGPLVILGEYPFIPNFFSNGTYGAGGTANYESISSIMGYQANKDGSICYVPERFPENWYRRSTPYGVLNGLIPGLVPTYLAGPPVTTLNPLGILRNGAQASQIGCAIYQGITSAVPASLLGSSVEAISQTSKYIQQKLAPGAITLFSCDINQNSLQTNATGGGQYNDKMQASGNGGDKKYGKICA